MKISDFIFRYAGRGGSRKDSICRVRIFAKGTSGPIVVATDLWDKSIGPSITNSIEHLWSALVDRGHVDESAILIQHYEENGSHEDAFDIVTFAGPRPRWSPVSIGQVAVMAGCGEIEFLSPTLQNERLAKEIEMLRTQIDPFVDMPHKESVDSIVRRADILLNMKSLAEIKHLLDSNASERRIHDLLRSDLSIIAEVYAPDDEYICFSEFPLGVGKVDFAIFSGRSRMDVVLIEIKGANFPIANRTGYRNISYKMNEATQQIRERLDYIYRNYNSVRREFHVIRERAESGENLYGCLVGPFGPLEVDPEKDVRIEYVVIAGRTTDDLKESRLRHAFEQAFNPSIRLETWDSWMRKLRRL